jgi:hypothetical protein
MRSFMLTRPLNSSAGKYVRANEKHWQKGIIPEAVYSHMAMLSASASCESSETPWHPL